MEPEFRRCSCCQECKDTFKVTAIRPNQKYAMRHGPRGRVLCKCDDCQANPEKGVWFDNPDKWGRRRKYARGHNTRIPEEREKRAKQININRENSKEKIDAARQTDSYKQHMSESQKKRWTEMKNKEPEKAKEIIIKLHDGRNKIVYTDEMCEQRSIAHYKYINEHPDEFAASRKKANKSNIGKHNSPEFVHKITKVLQSQERRDIVSKTHKGKPKSETMKQKLRDLWKDEAYSARVLHNQAAGNGKHEPSVPELLFFDLFQMNDIPLEYSGYSGFSIKRFVPDFINRERKVIVECYGYRHTTPRVMRRDEARRSAYAEAGYVLLEFWSYHIQSERKYENARMDEEEIIRQIRSVLD